MIAEIDTENRRQLALLAQSAPHVTIDLAGMYTHTLLEMLLEDRADEIVLRFNETLKQAIVDINRDQRRAALLRPA